MTRLSNRQHPMLKMFATERKDYHMTIEGAQQFDQRPFRSMLIQEWIEYVPGRGFRITPKGRAAWLEFETTNILRMNPLAPLTAYFDPDAYGRKKNNVRVMKGAA